MTKVAILGVGKMGSAMARELVNAGVEVALWNRTKQSVDELASSINNPLCSSVDSVPDALLNTDIAICTFTDGQVTQSVLLSDSNVLKSADRKLIIVDMGTSGIESAKHIDNALKKAGLRFIDAPVSGSVATISAHQLLVMASGSAEAVNEIRPVMEAFAKKVVYLGAAGTGQAMKLAVNLIVHSLNAAVAEALALATSAGISPSEAYDVFEDSVIAAPFVKYKRAAFLDTRTPVAMRIDTVVKDLRLIQALARIKALQLIATDGVEELYVSASRAGFQSADMANLFCHVNDLKK